MLMAPRWRKLCLTAHVVCSVGWLGAISTFLALAVLGFATQDDQLARAVYLVMEPIAWFVLVPLAFASLLTGIIQSMGTTWGLVRHYWVLFKLVINLGAIGILLMYTQTLGFMARVAGDPATPVEHLSGLRSSPVLHSALALLLLAVATVLAVYKPKGLTGYGRRKRRAEARAA